MGTDTDQYTVTYDVTKTMEREGSLKGFGYCVLVWCMMGAVLVCGCSSLSGRNRMAQNTPFITGENAIVTDENNTAVDVQSYEEELKLLEKLLNSYDEALAAHQEGNLGLAETKLEVAFVLAKEVDFEIIVDEELASRFRDAFISISQEYGRILDETSVTAEEDPMAWLDEIDADQFKSGKWTDEELKKIILKIATKSDVPIEYNERVRNAIYYFQNGGREELSKWLKRSGRYLPIITEIFEEEDIPLDMGYLSMIESGFNPRAYSRARATGLWQFIYSTGKLYGLNRNQWVDERRDPVKSTRAAAKHLNDLYEMTDDWNIVMAAYNCGAQRINRQLKKNENIEFWEMQLPRETRNYVPSYMAALCIAKAPEIFGFENIEKDSPLEYDIVEVKPYTNLNAAAKCVGVDIQTLKDLNPELLLDHVPPGKEKYELKIPKDTKELFLAAYEEIPVEEYEPPKVTSIRVSRGDTFSIIARRYGVSINSLRAANPHIKNIQRLPVGQLINIPGTSGGAIQRSISSNPVTQPRSRSSSNTTTYTIRKNDTLGTVAEQFHTTVRTLQDLNDMGRRTTIYVGQKLVVPASNDGSRTVTTESGRIVYIVQKNDTLYDIALKYGVDIQKIKELNQIKDHRKIMPGQKIIIEK